MTLFLDVIIMNLFTLSPYLSFHFYNWLIFPVVILEEPLVFTASTILYRLDALSDTQTTVSEN